LHAALLFSNWAYESYKPYMPYKPYVPYPPPQLGFLSPAKRGNRRGCKDH